MKQLKPTSDFPDIEEMQCRIRSLENRVEELETLIGIRSQFDFPFEVAIKLSPMRERLMGMLATLPEVPSELAFSALYGARERSPNFNVLSVHMSHIRKILTQFGITVETIHGFGWFLSPADRAKLRRFVK